MESGRPEKDFICKAIAGHKGGIDELAYISTNECRFDGQEKSVVCTVSSDSTVRAWDVQEGTEIWSSPLQPAALVNLVTYPRLQLVVTVDKLGLIKVWKAENGREWASFSLPTYSSALQACDHPEGPFLLVSDWLLGVSAGPSCLPGSRTLCAVTTVMGGAWSRALDVVGQAVILWPSTPAPPLQLSCLQQPVSLAPSLPLPSRHRDSATGCLWVQFMCLCSPVP